MNEEDAITIPQQDAGLAGSSRQSYTSRVLVTGQAPTKSTAERVADATVANGPLPAYSVVGRNADNELVLARENTAADGEPSNAIPPIGVTTVTVAQGTTGGSVPTWRDGCFNLEALTWHASFDTDESKRLAFENGSNEIYIRKAYKEGA